MNTWTIIILGITGDLSRRKLIPALYQLMRHNAPIGLIVGTGREPVTADLVLDHAQPFIPEKDLEKDPTWQALKDIFYYQPLDFANGNDFIKLEQMTTAAQKKHHVVNGPRLFYLATPADYFCMITDYLVQAGLMVSNRPDHRIVYEKPFGWDLASAKHINHCIKQVLAEDQVYRIDHYLAKEFVNNLLLLRYANTLFKDIWSNSAIEAVKILFWETIGLEGRGSFYDHYGALKDVLQNHMLQIVALVAMDPPSSLTSDAIRDKKADILRSVHAITGVLGQYEGYHAEPHVRPDSATETFAAVKLLIDHPRWQGVPFYLETGKKLSKKATEIHLILKPIAHCLWSPHNTCQANTITIQISPSEGFSLQVNTKRPGTLNEITTVTLNFSYTNVFGPISAEAYEIILQEIMAGQQSIAVRFDEIEYQWNIIEQIRALNLPLFTYQQGSPGPVEAQALMHERT